MAARKNPAPCRYWQILVCTKRTDQQHTHTQRDFDQEERHQKRRVAAYQQKVAKGMEETATGEWTGPRDESPKQGHLMRLVRAMMVARPPAPQEPHLPSATRAKMPTHTKDTAYDVDGDTVSTPTRWALISVDDLNHIRRLIVHGLGTALGEPALPIPTEPTDDGLWLRRTTDGRIEGNGLGQIAQDYAALHLHSKVRVRMAATISPVRGWPLDFVDARDALERLDDPRAFSLFMSYLRGKKRRQWTRVDQKSLYIQSKPG
jgi:hypothetical protein